MNLFANIESIKYKPMMCRELKKYRFIDLKKALNSESSFILKINNDLMAVSLWVSPKRTRSYPYARIYDTLRFVGKKITIIPVIKDEGLEGDRDFIQWDTISLMSLLGIYIIISYYKDADCSDRYKNKITNQRLDENSIKHNIERLVSFQSDALHWNLEQADCIPMIMGQALDAYRNIANYLGIKMHSEASARRRVAVILRGKEAFMEYSRVLSSAAQKRETNTIQPKEKLMRDAKASITIKNYLGGYYFFTVDEIEKKGNQVYLIESKHSKNNLLPSLEDIKDGLLKMVVFTNLKDLRIGANYYLAKPVLRLTSAQRFSNKIYTKSQEQILGLLYNEARCNNFEIRLG